MAVYLIGYNLKENSDYKPVWDSIKKIGEYVHLLNSTWLVYTDDDNVTPKSIIETLRPHLSKEERVFIVPVTQPYQGFLTEKHWEWINDRIKR